MKHSITILLICFSFIMHGQDFSKILKGEWLVSPMSANAAFTQTWDFTSDSVLIVTRKDGSQEEYNYEIYERFLYIYIISTDSLLDTEDEVSFALYKYSELNISAMLQFSNQDFMFTKKSTVSLGQPSIQLDQLFFDNKTYRVSSSKSTKMWHDKLIRSHNEISAIFIGNTCLTSFQYLIINAPRLNIIVFDDLGSLQVIEQQDSSWIKTISLNDRSDTILLELVKNKTNSFAKTITEFRFKKLKEENLKYVLKGIDILSVKTGYLHLFEDGTGKFNSGIQKMRTRWLYFFDDIIVFECYVQELKPGRGGLLNLVDVKKDIFLKLERLENGKILATSMNCNEEKMYFLGM